MHTHVPGLLFTNLFSERDNKSQQPCSRRWVGLCFALTFLVYFLFIPQILKYSSPPTGDQPYYLMDTLSLVQDGDIELSNNYANHDEDKFYSLAPHPSGFVGMNAIYPLTPQMIMSTARPESEIYSYHLPGLPVLLAPAWFVGSLFQLWWPATIVFMCVLGSLLATNIFLLAYETTGNIKVAWAVWGALAFSSPIMSYSYLIFTELPVGLVAIYAFRRLVIGWRDNGPVRLALIGACIGFIPWLALRCAPISVGLFLFAVVQWYRSTPSARLRGLHFVTRMEVMRRMVVRRAGPMMVRAFCFFAPILVMGGLMVAYNLFLFNSVLPVTEERGGSGEGMLYLPWQGEYELRQFINGAFGLMFSQNFGLLLFTPVYLLAVVGIFAMFRGGSARSKHILRWAAIVGLPYFGLMASYSHWGGDWCPPARYMTSLVPLLSAPLAASLSSLAASRVYKVLFGFFSVVGFGFMGVMLYNPLTMWSTNPGTSEIFDWLATAPVNVDVRPLLPRFYTPDEVWFPWRTGWMLGASVIVALGGLLLLIRHKPRPRSMITRRFVISRILVSWAVILPLIAGWLVINRDFLRAKTTFEYVNHWNLPEILANPGAIAYLDGHIYIPQFGIRTESGWGQGSVKAFDVRTGEYSAFTAEWADGRGVPWAHPGSVVVGPDGYLYVLNNGEGDEALLVMDSSGKIVRGIELKGKTILGKGLYFGEDGTLYMADQSMGSVMHYAATGGEPLKEYKGTDSILNNPRGVAADADGNIYTAETFTRIQKLGSDDRIIAQFDLYCVPRYFASGNPSPTWIEATCRTGLLSINTTNDYVQLAQYKGDGPRPNSPSGLTYGPDDTLYVIDVSSLLAYKVRH